MLLFLLKRLAIGLLLALTVMTAVFFLLRVYGPDPARMVLGNTATPTQLRQESHLLGTDGSLMGQYLSWLSSAAQGNLGTSWSTSQQVGQTISSGLPITLSITLSALTVSLVAGLGIGVFAAVRPGWIDRVLQIVVIGAFALPGFWLAMVLVGTFAVNLNWFPATGYTALADSPVGWLRGITLPVLSLSLGIVASIAQQFRNSVIEVNRQDFVRTLRSRGLSPARVLYKHVLRNAAGPALTVASLQFVGLLSGAVIVEQVFDLHGLGTAVQSAAATGDVPVVMGVVAVTVTVVVLVNLAVDVLLAWLNPKVRVR